MVHLNCCRKLITLVVIAKINYIFLVAIKFYLLVQFKSKVLMVKSSSLTTDDLPITIKQVKKKQNNGNNTIIKSKIFFVIQKTLTGTIAKHTYQEKHRQYKSTKEAPIENQFLQTIKHSIMLETLGLGWKMLVLFEF